MPAQQETNRGNITVTFCGVSIPAEGSPEFRERGTLVGQVRIVAEELFSKTSVSAMPHGFQQRFRGGLAPTRNTLKLSV